MATSNFYTGGNNGLNVILPQDESEGFTQGELGITIENIVSELTSKGYSVDSANHLTRAPRSFETGQGFLVYNKNAKIVAFLEVCFGYYEHANVDVYLLAGMSDDEMVDEFEELVCEYDINRGWYIDRKLFTKDKRHAKRVMTAVEKYTTKVVMTA